MAPTRLFSRTKADAATRRTRMSTTTDANDRDTDLTAFLRDYARDDVMELAQHFPNEQQSLEVSWRDLHTFNPAVGDRLLSAPGETIELLEEALRQYDLPADVSLAEAHVRVGDLPEEYVYYPGEFSPTDEAGVYRGITGEVSRSTDVYSKVVEAAFECQRCGTVTYIPQNDSGFQEPHECQGCERQGPFRVDDDQSSFIDAQLFKVQTPPEIASGAGQEIEVFVEDDLADEVTIGDRITVHGTLHREQITNGGEKTGKFEPYLDGHHIEVKETDHTDLEITAEERERIHELANGAEGDPLEAAGASLKPRIFGHDLVKQMLILSMVGGARVEYGDDDFDRGEFHILLLGDPGTAKSELLERVEEIGFRVVGVSGQGATTAGITATAKQDNFGDGDWTLSAGAFVKANKGTVTIDELDDMPPEVRSAMLEPMSKQSIHITKGGINTRLSTQTAVCAAANPTHGRFDEYSPFHEQTDFASNLVSRFDLIFVMLDKPDEEEDAKVTDHMLTARDAQKRMNRGEEVGDDEKAAVDRPVEPEILRKWIALAKQQPAPVFENEEVRQQLSESFNSLRGMHGYDDDSPVPVTFRKLKGTVRLAEAVAKFEFSEVITERHATIATKAVGKSMRDFNMNGDGELDADTQETGTSKSQRDQMELIGEVISDLMEENDEMHADRTAVVDEVCARDSSIDESRIEELIYKMRERKGVLIRPEQGRLRFLGW